MKLLLLFLLIEFVHSNVYYLESCCSRHSSTERISFSCDWNHQIRLNRIELFYHSSNETCSSSSSTTCCQQRTSCSRRITKYFTSICDEHQFCSIDNTCLKIHQTCASENHFYGQFLTIHYSCLPNNRTTMPFLIKLLTIDNPPEDLPSSSSSSSSSLFFFALLFTFVSSMLSIYCFARWIGRRVCLRPSSRSSKELKEQKLLLRYHCAEKRPVQSTSSSPSTRIYPYIPSQLRPYINVYQDPRTGQITSRTFYSYY